MLAVRGAGIHLWNGGYAHSDCDTFKKCSTCRTEEREVKLELILRFPGLGHWRAALREEPGNKRLRTASDYI
jgi:hypothetical protein